MYDNIERELKILIDKETYQNIMNSYDFHTPIEQTNTYYDDENKTIKSMHGALRIRTIQNKHFFTLKIKKDEYTHYEFEKEVNTDNLQNIQDLEVLQWLKEYNIPKNLKQTATFTTIRRTYDFENGELCLDQTFYANHTDYELEYEYTSEHDGISFFNSILKPYGLEWKKNCPSKIARAFLD